MNAKMSAKRFSRRAFLTWTGLAGTATILAACRPAVVKEPEAPAKAEQVEKAVPATPSPLKGTLSVFAGAFAPTDSMEKSEENPLPSNKLLEIIGDYQEMHPGIEVELVTSPSGVRPREWQIASQSAGTIPHILPVAPWVIKEDLEKDWWVELTPFLNTPNPYIQSGDPGSKRWIDQFYPTPTSMLLLDGGYYNIAFGIVTTWFYYNVDIFNDLGIEQPQSYAQFLENCKVIQDAGMIGYDFITLPPSDSDAWYRAQLGSMIMARDIESLVNPGGGAVDFDDVACAIKRGDYHARLPHIREWMELWKLNVPYRREDWAVPAADANRLWLTKRTPVLEQGGWAIPRIEIDPDMDFEWATHWAPPLTKESSAYVTDPPTQAPNVGTVTGSLGMATRAVRDGLLDTAVDFLEWWSHPDNVTKLLAEIWHMMPNVRNVPVDDRFADAFPWVVESMGYVTMFSYEICVMDQEAAERCGQAWWAYLLDEMSIDQAIDEQDAAFTEYADRYLEGKDMKC